MEKGFWLVVLDDLSATVSLVTQTNGQYRISSTGLPQDWIATNPETIVHATDASLSATAAVAGTHESDEPSSAAFILPPFWIGSDGKIASNYLKLVESICRDLKLKPLGFISSDEAVTEAANSADSFPSSFIFIYINRQILTLSLVYLGKVKSRLNRVVSGVFDPKIIEDILVEIQGESTLPPQIILAGNIDDTISQQVKNYPWIGKKNIETFLHFPSVSVYNHEQLTAIYCQVVSHQFNPQPQAQSTANTYIASETEVDDIEIEPEDNQLENEVAIQEVLPVDMGFSADEPEIEPPVLPPPQPPVVINKPSLPTFKFPKFQPPRIVLPKINMGSTLWLIPVLLVLVISFVGIFSQATISLKLTPYPFSQTKEVDLAQVASKKTFDINSTASIKTTGQKTVGTVAKGEIVIYNKLDKLQTVPKNTILLSDNNLKFELSSLAQVAASSSNYDTGTITMGQTKTFVSATEIGNEYNIAKDVKLTFKDPSLSFLVAKANQVFTGGTKKIAAAVSAEDKVSLEQKIKSDVTSSIDSRLNQDVKSISDAIDETIDVKRNRIEYTREVGEEAEEVSATSSNTVSVYFFTQEQKSKIINSVLSDSPNFSESTLDVDSFKLTFIPSSPDKSKGKLTIVGSGRPKVNNSSLQKNLSGKNQKSAQQIIRKLVPRAYNFQITTNLPLLDSFNPLPFISKNITIESK